MPTRQSIIVTSVFFALVLALTFAFSGQSKAADPSDPINTIFKTRPCSNTEAWLPPKDPACTADYGAGNIVNTTTYFEVQTGGPNFNQDLGVMAFTPNDVSFHEDTIPIGALVGAFYSRTTLGLINGSCGPGENTPVLFAFFNSTVDPATDGILHPTLSEDTGVGTTQDWGTLEGSRADDGLNGEWDIEDGYIDWDQNGDYDADDDGSGLGIDVIGTALVGGAFDMNGDGSIDGADNGTLPFADDIDGGGDPGGDDGLLTIIGGKVDWDNDADVDDDPGDLGTYNGPALTNGVPAHAEMYPSYLLAMFDPDFTSLGDDNLYGTADDVDGPDDPVLPAARYGGQTPVAGMAVVLEYLVFAPGSLAAAFDDPHPYSDFSDELGYGSMFVLNDPTLPDAPSSISDFCTILSTTHIGFGASRDNPCTDGTYGASYSDTCDTIGKINNADTTTGDIPSGLWYTATPDTCDADSDESGCVRYRNAAANTGYGSDIRLVKASSLDATHLVGVAVKAGDADIGTALVAFNANEMHTDPASPTVFNVGEWVYRNNDGGPPYVVSDGDTRLVHPTLGTGVAVACPADADCGKALVAFAANEKHDETVNANAQFDPGEGIYRDADGSGTVNVVGTGTHRAPNFTQTYRDADNDGIESAFDTCPRTATLGYNPRLTDYTTDNDQDAMPGVKVIAGLLDVNLPTHDNVITGADDGTVAGKGIIDGFVDMDGDGDTTVPDTGDDGVLLGFDVDDGYVDMDGDDSVPPDAGDNGTINGCDPTPNANSGLGNHDLDVGGFYNNPYLNGQDNCPLAANGADQDNQEESETDAPWSTAAPNGGSRGDSMGNLCETGVYDATNNEDGGADNDCGDGIDNGGGDGLDKGDADCYDGGTDDIVANGHFHTYLNLGLQDRGGGYEAVFCIGATDTDGDGVCDATEDALGSYKYNKHSTPESIAWDYSMPLTNRGSGADADSDGVPANDDADDNNPGVGGTVDDDAVNTPAGQAEEPFQSCNDDIDNDSDGLKDDEEADCNGAGANPDTDLDGIPDIDEDACSTVAGIKNDAAKVPERLGNGVDDDGDTNIDNAQAPVSGSDCDGDGFNDDVEAALTWPAQVGPTAETEGAGQCNDYFDDDATDSGEDLTADLDNTQTDVAVTDGTTFSVGDLIKVGIEDYIKITDIVGDTLTVKRGVPKLTHSTGDDVFDKDGVVNDGCPEPGVGHQERCGDSAGTNDENDDQWPADFNDDQKLNIADVNIFASPTMHFNELVANHHRWDLSGAGTKINLVDVNLLGTKRAPMFYVQPVGPSYDRIFGNDMYTASGKCPADDLSPPP